MPLNETDKAWVRQEIQSAYKRHGFGKFTGFIKDWSGAGAALAVVLFFVTQWGAYVEFRTNAKDRLDAIDKSLVEIKGDLSKLRIQATASLPLADFQQRLPELGSALSTAGKERRAVPANVVTEVQQKLLATDRGTSDFWPTMSQFITYRSIIFAPNVDIGNNLPDCLDRDLLPMRVLDSPQGNPPQVHFSSSEYSNCRVTLDSQKDGDRVNFLVTHTAPFLTFSHCIVVYRGGPINLIVAMDKVRYGVKIGHSPAQVVPLTGATLHFENCVFDFSMKSPPPPSGQQVAEFLLANNSLSVDLPLKKEA